MFFLGDGFTLEHVVIRLPKQSFHQTKMLILVYCDWVVLQNPGLHIMPTALQHGYRQGKKMNNTFTC